MLSKDELPLVSQRMSGPNEKLFRSMTRPLHHPYADYARWCCKKGIKFIVKKKEKRGLREALLAQVMSSLKHYLQNKYLQNIVKNFH